jgi:tetratricopeptide (TPR) repeat protein
MRPARAWGIIAAAVLIGSAVCADEPARTATARKPPWQWLLQGEDARRAAQQEKELVQLQEAGKFAEALPLAQALAKRRAEVQGADHWEAAHARREVVTLRRVLRLGEDVRQKMAHAYTQQRQATTLFSRGRYKEAQPLWEQSLATFRSVLGEDHPDTATAYNNVAVNLSSQGRYAEAGTINAQALAIRLKVLDENDPDLAFSYSAGANILNEQGRYAEAAEFYARALAIRLKVLGEEHEATATSFANQAVNLEEQGRHAEAAEGFRKALAIQRKVLGEDHPDIATSYNSIGRNLQEQGRYAEAAEFYGKALTLRRKMLGEDHPDTAGSYNTMASNLNAQGHYAEAEEFHSKALAICRKVLGENHPNTATCYNNLARNLMSQGRYVEAAELYRKALTLRRKVLGEEHPDMASAYNNEAMNLRLQGHYAEAEENFRKALAIRRKLLGEDHPLTALSYNNLATNLAAAGRHPEAADFCRKALAIYRKVLGEDHPLTTLSAHNVASNLHARGRYAEAEALWLVAADRFAGNRLHIAAAGLDRAAITGKNSPLPSLAAVLARNSKPEAAWQRFEESLGRGTWDDVSARLHRPPAEQAKQAEISARLQQLDQRIEKTPTVKEPTPAQEQQRKDLLTHRRQIQDELDAFVHRLEQTYGPVAGQVLDRVRIQAALAADTALVGWLDLPGPPKAADLNGEHWAVLLRAAGAPVWVRLRGSGPGGTWTEADTRLAADLRAALHAPRGDWQPLAQRLRQQRLEPLMKHLAASAEQPAVHHLLVLPARALAGVPVEVFAQGYTVSYALSGTLHAHLRAQPRLATQGLLAVADPAFETLVVAQNPLPLPPAGVLLTMVTPGANAAQAGLKPNDVLLR